MATFGWGSPNWSSSWNFFGFNTENNVSSVGVGFPQPGGTVTGIVFNCDNFRNGQPGPMVAQGCLWNNSGGLLVAGSQVTLASVGQHAGPYTWHVSTCSYHFNAGDVIRIGWWRNPAQSAGDNIFGFGFGGPSMLGTTANSGGPGGFGQDGSIRAQIGAYVIWTPDTPPPAPAPPPPPTPTPGNPSLGNPYYQSLIYELQREGLIPK